MRSSSAVSSNISTLQFAASWDMQELYILVETSESIHIEDTEEMGG
jgi:hypothetical protein